MTMTLPVGRLVHVTVPASSANLGAGFDTLGIAVDLCDDVDVEIIPAGLEIIVSGEGEGEVPLNEDHLVVRALRAGLSAADAVAPGLKVTCRNRIPQSRGMGSSAAAAVAGVAAANGLCDFPLDAQQVIQLASEFEGHPDNVAASVLGGAVAGWTDCTEASDPIFHAATIPVNAALRATALVPSVRASTQEVRKVLPAQISHMDARFNVARCALMVVALEHDPSLLMEATRDLMHQPYRFEVLTITAQWVNRLREAGFPAYLSGAGPTVMVLTDRPVDSELLEAARAEGLTVHELDIAGPVQVTTHN